jgi:hypothetical protein
MSTTLSSRKGRDGSRVWEEGNTLEGQASERAERCLLWLRSRLLTSGSATSDGSLCDGGRLSACPLHVASAR